MLEVHTIAEANFGHIESQCNSKKSKVENKETELIQYNVPKETIQFHLSSKKNETG